MSGAGGLAYVARQILNDGMTLSNVVSSAAMGGVMGLGFAVRRGATILLNKGKGLSPAMGFNYHLLMDKKNLPIGMIETRAAGALTKNACRGALKRVGIGAAIGLIGGAVSALAGLLMAP